MTNEEKRVIAFGVICIVVCEAWHFLLGMLFPGVFDEPVMQEEPAVQIEERKTIAPETTYTASTYTVDTTKSIKLDLDEFELFTKAVYAEVGHEDIDTQICVAEVILRRMASPEFPNSLRGVLMAPREFNNFVVNYGSVIMGKGELAHEVEFGEISKTTISACSTVLSKGTWKSDTSILFFAEDPKTGETIFSDKPII